MGIVVGAILILAGTVAWAAAGYLAEAFRGGGFSAVVLAILGSAELALGFMTLRAYQRANPTPR